MRLKSLFSRTFHKGPNHRIVAMNEKIDDLLPPPFEWVEIPGGRVSVEDASGPYAGRGTKGGTYEIPAFAIAKYPVTNAQYAKFIEAGGYQVEQWWTKTGWQTKNSRGNRWNSPLDWNDEQINRPNNPVVGVSWYEALAFSLWLSEGTGDHIRLPTEQQWLRAMTGDNRWNFPWGNTWDSSRCNNSVEANSADTTPVTQYPAGASPYGVMDLVGNVWEWCLTQWYVEGNDLEGNEGRVLHGGSFHSINKGSSQFRATVRMGRGEQNREKMFGFRTAATLVAD